MTKKWKIRLIAWIITIPFIIAIYLFCWKVLELSARELGVISIMLKGISDIIIELIIIPWTETT